MNKFLALVVLVASVAARPDIGLKLRQQGYGAPSGSYLPGSFQQQQQFVQQNPGFSGQGSGPLNSYQTSGLVEQGVNQFSQGFAPVRHENYFFDAPEDLGPTHVRVHVQPSGAAAHKTIFIKAPAYQSKVVPHFNLPQQQLAGKTNIFVLVKKPDQHQDIVVPASVQGPAAKPEVTFLTYTSQKDAEAKIQGIQQGSASGGDSAKVVYNHQELISSIKDQPQQQQQQDYFSGFPQISSSSLSSGPGAFNQPAANGEETFISNTITKDEPSYGPAGLSGPY